MQRGSASTRARKEESIISFEVGLDEAIELPGVAVEEVAASTDALLSPSRGTRTTAVNALAPTPPMNGASAAPALTAALRSSAMASTSSLHTAVPSRAKSGPQPAGPTTNTVITATPGGVTSPTATSTHTTRTPSSGSGNGNRHGGSGSAGGGSSFHTVSPLTWADTSAVQREAEARASHEDRFHPMLLCPLQNLGNTCYFNSGVQLLVNCPALVYGLRASPFGRSTAAVPSNSPLSASPSSRPATAARLCLRGSAATHALCQEFSMLLASMDTGCGNNDHALSPIRTLDALARVYPQFEGRSQQDASEMVTALLASLEEEGGQYAEVSQLLLSLEDAAAAQRRLAQSSSAGSSRHVASTSTSVAAAGVPLPARCAEPYVGEEFSQPSPLSATSADPVLPGPRSAHCMTVLRLMEQVNRENEELERRVKERAGRPYTGSFRPPRLHFNPLVDAFRGYSLSQVKCHHCRAVSRVVSPFNGLMLDVPTTKQRRRFAVAHPDVPRRMDPDGQPRQVKKPFRLTWWNPISICAAAWAQIKRLFEGPFLYPLWLDECLDIHFEPELLHGTNKYRCESCGTASDATKSESLLQLPEYLLVHMKRFEAGRFFNRKKTDSVFFPAAWQPLTPAQAQAQTPPSGSGGGSGRHRPSRAALPEFLDLRSYLHSSVAGFAEPLPACLASAATSASSSSSSTNKHASGYSTSRAEPHSHTQAHHHHHRASPSGAANTATSATPEAGGTANRHAAGSTIATTYSLDGIVNHHGGYDGGHYTVFLHKTTEQQRVWVYISDDEVERAEEVVATDTEYVLLYRRQPLVQAPPESDEAEQLRRKACYYLSPTSGAAAAAMATAAATATTAANARNANGTSTSAGGGADARERAQHLHSPSSFSSSSTDGPAPAGPAAASSTSSVVYISRMWLQRVAFMREPGPIVNLLCYCRLEDRQRVSMYPSLFPASVKVPAEVPHVHGPPVEWFYAPITPADYEIFYNAFGGNTAVSVSEYEALRDMQVEFCADIDAAERQRQRGGMARHGMRR